VRLIEGILGSLFPPSPEPLRELRAGQRAIVRGTVVPRDLMPSPLTGDRCVYYQYTLERWRQSRVAGVGGDGFWDLTQKDEAILEFYLQDAEGERAIVSPHRATVERGRRVAVQEVDVGVLHQRAQQLLIIPGDLVEVSGRVDRVDDIYDEGRDYRASPTRLMLRATGDEPLTIRLIGPAARL
jgi:hypothetical protein